MAARPAAARGWRGVFRSLMADDGMRVAICEQKLVSSFHRQQPPRRKPIMKKTMLACVIAATLMTSSVHAYAQERAPAQTYTIFMKVKTTPTWLALSNNKRMNFVRQTIEPILGRHPAVGIRFFESEFYSANVTDIFVVQTQDLGAYQKFVDALRETPFWDQYFEVVSILPSVENNYTADDDDDDDD
jgi:hypothetical protein